ncbi:MAG: OmcA/MtrC family decaheme c-type cytochrome [Halioglobus sp.]
MATGMHNWIAAGLIGLLVACGGGGGGGDRAPGIDPGPAPPGGSVPPPEPEIPAPNPAPYAEVENLFVLINKVTLPEDGRAVVEFQLSDENNTGIIDLEADNVRFIIAKLQGSPLGNLTGTWQSYINRIEQAGSVGEGTEARLQATTESNGEFTNNQNGTYVYRFATDVYNLPPEILEQADSEELNLAVESERTHRVAIQFGGGGDTANPIYDWIPDTGATDNVFNMDISATPNCNRCHDKLAFHGGGRVEVQYCVTCHNAGSTDANSANTVDMKVMIHKIHMGANLPSVQAGGEYAIYGFRDTKHDYSNVHYPQDIRNCVNCHAGTGTGSDREDLVLTNQGDNWNEYPARASCGSCHDQLDFEKHAGGQPDDSRCASCHGVGGRAGSPEESHRIAFDQAREAFQAEIIAVDSTAPGETPVVTFKVSNPLTGEDYDIDNDPVWTNAQSSLNVKMAWNTGDYNNTGNNSENASSVSTGALGGAATSNGDGSYSLTLSQSVPDGSEAPGIRASGSGAATIEGHPGVDYNEDGEPDAVPVGDVAAFFSIDEVDGSASPRRQAVTIQQCNACHSSLVLHGNNRADNIDSCVTCHNPRNTDRDVRKVAASPPTDGKQEESINFTTMVHGIHAAGIRENPLQIVGFRGFTTYVYDEDTVHYPGNIGNCLACHTEDGYLLPLADSVLATTVDTGDDRQDPTDDLVTTPATAACASCHDDQVAKAHMTSNGGSFDASQQAVDDGEVVEQCTICHASGKANDVATSHPVRALP